MGTHALPDIYALVLRPQARGQVHIYQAKHSCPWYNYYIYIDVVAKKSTLYVYNSSVVSACSL